ncbi:hypothetical protein HELRODRAFT_68515 [Helobdella robusta]|uniref:C2H2-type domain-containing protein n=1 Tax=Helobdella robusta TaxID=6412 RepID=T1FZG2_HELRO|nr:hypothetical protein HELRODRAFT_68515 [Helobdella robusta]ESN96228.1 hypothetical protein HELRODRAFT_68515 [Helobdella robusta]
MKCIICDKMFKGKNQLNKHLRSHSNLVKKYLKHCRTCHKTFCSQSNLRRHMKTHTRVKNFFCEKCGKRIRGLKAFKNHVCSIDGIHKGSYKERKPRIKAFNDCYDDETKSTEETMCDVCGKVLSSVASLHKHAITHGAKNHICEQCGKGFHHREYLKEHYIQKHGEGKYKTCPVCQKVLKGRNSYDSHVLRMHPNLKNKDAPPSYICPECGKVFNQKGNMYKHQLSHSSNLNFKCHHCNISFKYPEQLRRHMLWHNGGPKYECHLCDRKFVLKFQLTKHINEYHGGVVLTCKYCDVTIKRFVVNMFILFHCQHFFKLMQVKKFSIDPKQLEICCLEFEIF